MSEEKENKWKMRGCCMNMKLGTSGMALKHFFGLLILNVWRGWGGLV